MGVRPSHAENGTAGVKDELQSVPLNTWASVEEGVGQGAVSGARQVSRRRDTGKLARQDRDKPLKWVRIVASGHRNTGGHGVTRARTQVERGLAAGLVRCTNCVPARV